MATYQYSVEIKNDYLGKYRRVTGRSRREVEIKASEQLQRWSDQEARARLRQANNDAKEAALEATEQARGLIQAYRTVLASTLAVDDRVDWRSLMDERPFSVSPPQLAQSRKRLNVPAERPLVEAFSKKSKARREAAELAAEQDHRRALADWERRRDAYERDRKERNAAVSAFRMRYEQGDPAAVEQYISLVLASSALPEGLDRECAVRFIPRRAHSYRRSDRPATVWDA